MIRVCFKEIESSLFEGRQVALCVIHSEPSFHIFWEETLREVYEDKRWLDWK